MKLILKFTQVLWMLVCIQSGNLFAQAPPGIPYQAIARNANGTPYVNANLTVRFSLHEQTANGTVSYAESHNLQTNDLGLFSTTFGSGTPITGTFAGINWAQTTKFLRVEINLGSAWVDLGTQQLMSVPYAIYAANSGSGTINQGTRIGYGQSGSWTCPPSVTQVTIECWGGGGAGQQFCPTPGANGGNGGYNRQVVNTTPGNTYSIVIGNGGIALPFYGDFANCNTNVILGPGGNGGTTSFGNTIFASGGQGGSNGINGANGAVINWPYSSAGTSGNVPYIPSSWVQNPPTGLAAGGLGTRYCGYTFLGCGATSGESGYCIISY